MRGWSVISRLAISAFAVGAVALLLADAEYLRVISAAILLAGIVLAVFAIATPESLAEEPPQQGAETSGGPGPA